MPDSRHETFVVDTLPDVDRYKLVTGLVTPRPIGWIGSMSSDGVPNLAPFSFFNAVCTDPITLMFSVGASGRAGGDGRKDTLANVLEAGEFSVNVVSEDLVEAMNLSSGEYGSDVDEFALSGLTLEPGTATAAPMVAEARAQFECCLTHTVELGVRDGVPSSTVVFGEAQVIHVDPAVLSGTRIRLDELRTVGRLAGSAYSRAADGYFELARPSR